MDHRSKPACYYCDGTGVDEFAVRLDVDHYRSGPCDLCEGTGEALHSANTDTTYRHRDPLLSLRDYRRYGRRHVAAYKAGTARDDGFDVYLNVKRSAIGKPVRLPADRKTATVLHPVFTGMFRSMGLAA